MVGAQLEAVILLTPIAGIDALVMLQVKIFGRATHKPITYQRDAVVCVLCFLCAVFLNLGHQLAASAIGQTDGAFAAFFLDQHHALHSVTVLQRHVLVENIRIGTQCGIGFAVILQQIEGHMGFGETFVLYISVGILHCEADFTGVYLLGAIQYSNNVVAQNRIVGFRQAGIGQLVHTNRRRFVNDQSGYVQNGEVALAIVGSKGICSLQAVQFQPAAFCGGGICLVGYSVMPGHSCFAVIHGLAVHGAAAADLSGERSAVDRTGINLLSNVVVAVGIIYQADGFGAGDGVFFEPQETVRQGMSVPIQSFTSLGFAISTRIGLLIHPNGIAVYNVIDQNVTNGGGSSRIVGFDVPGIVRIVQVTTVYSQRAGRNTAGVILVANVVVRVRIAGQRKRTGAPDGVAAPVNHTYAAVGVITGSSSGGEGHSVAAHHAAGSCQPLKLDVVDGCIAGLVVHLVVVMAVQVDRTLFDNQCAFQIAGQVVTGVDARLSQTQLYRVGARIDYATAAACRCGDGALRVSCAGGSAGNCSLNILGGITDGITVYGDDRHKLGLVVQLGAVQNSGVNLHLALIAHLGADSVAVRYAVICRTQAIVSFVAPFNHKAVTFVGAFNIFPTTGTITVVDSLVCAIRLTRCPFCEPPLQLAVFEEWSTGFRCRTIDPIPFSGLVIIPVRSNIAEGIFQQIFNQSLFVCSGDMGQIAVGVQWSAVHTAGLAASLIPVYGFSGSIVVLAHIGVEMAGCAVVDHIGVPKIFIGVPEYFCASLNTGGADAHGIIYSEGNRTKKILPLIGRYGVYIIGLERPGILIAANVNAVSRCLTAVIGD